MKISISYPPIESDKGVPLISQNRQFQWFHSPTFIYPIVPAYAASLLQKNGYEAVWDDGIAEKLSFTEWEKRILALRPDIIAIETKTPVIQKHWQIINDLKQHLPVTKIVLMGDHPTALPEESLQNSQADYILTGGDYDFMLLNLANHLAKGDLLETGWYFHDQNKNIINTGKFQLHHNLDELPFIDRELTKWKLYAYQNGNYKYIPGSYMMSGRDCWWGKCSFCSWTTLFPANHFRARSPQKALDEVEQLINLDVKEIMEDSGTLPCGNWLKEFCSSMIEKGYNKKIVMSCNMRINAIQDLETWKLMKQAGFRFILFGIESVNQNTLDKISKGLKAEEIEPSLKMCKQAGLEPHITTMIGYPWETKEDAEKTINFTKNLFKKGYIDTLQATIVIPYPGTPLYQYCQANNLLKFTDYRRYDQREQVMKNTLSTEDVKALTASLYKAFISPQFIARKLFNIRNIDDIKFLFRAGTKLLGHLTDFKK